MSFPAYPTHKDSGSEWIGEIPDHWSASPLKRAFKIEGGSTPPPDEANWDGDIAWVTPADLSGLSSLFLDASKRTITARGLASCGTTLLPAGSLILSTRAPIGSLAIGLISMCTNQGCKGLVPNANASAAYFAFVLLTAKGELNNRGRGSTFLEISGDELSRFSVPTPPFVEQTQIARFLDHETARIDALIEEQQRLIELLKEKRQAVISHAVTKGLDPNVPMKDSGVEWIGEVPAHWDVKALRYLGECQNGINIGGEAFGSGSPFVSYGDVHKNHVLPAEVAGLVQSSPEDQQRYSVRNGDVLFTRTSETVDEIGFSSTCLQSIENATFAGFLIRFRPIGESLSPHFSKYYFRNQGLRIFFNKEMNLVTRASLSQDLLKLLPVTVPPLSEQEKISGFLDRITETFASLLEQGLRSIELLTERRSALISAAVTGKIDVRGWQSPACVTTIELTLEAV